jgi:hypothetical protein
MHSTVEAWIEDLIEAVDEATATEEFQQWLDVQSRFHEYPHRNALLSKLQCPAATKVAGYNTWRTEFDRYVREGEQAIWIWAPIITTRCPRCKNSPSYHDRSDCEYDETPPEEWANGLVGFKPVPVFDVSQTDGDPLPDLQTDVVGGDGELLPALLSASDEFGLEVDIVTQDEWSYGEAQGVCKPTSTGEPGPPIKVIARENLAAVGFDPVGDCLKFIATTTRKRDVGPAVGQCFCRQFADSRGGPRHERDLPLDTGRKLCSAVGSCLLDSLVGHAVRRSCIVGRILFHSPLNP